MKAKIRIKNLEGRIQKLESVILSQKSKCKKNRQIDGLAYLENSL